jgi:hypothetical protein
MQVKAPKVPVFETGGGRHPLLPVTPMRGIILAPSNSGKTVLLTSLILDFYRGAFARIYVFSPSVNIDANWQPVKEYVHRHLGVDPNKERCFFEEWEPEELQKILSLQAKMVEYQKRHKPNGKRLHGILVVVDDWADSPEVMHDNKNVLSTLFVRGRHWAVSTLLSTQKFRAIATMIRVNAQFLVSFRLRNAKELEALLEELSALYPRKTLEAMYHAATEEPYSFWYIDLAAKKREEMFYLRFERPMLPADED